MIQNGITNFVNLLDNVMIGAVSTEAMSAVSIANQFIFIFNLMIFGAISAAGIFTAQYNGLKDDEGVRHTFRFKLIVTLVCTLVFIAVAMIFDSELISMFLHGEDVKGDLELTRELGVEYLWIMLIGLIPYAIAQTYASTLRETGEVVIPMYSSFISVITNFILNFVLIFGYLGFPALGVNGAAIGTVVARFAELIFVAVWTHKHKSKAKFIDGAYRSLKIPAPLVRKIIIKGMPLMLNEVFWSLAITLRNQCYSTRGLNVVAALSISITIVNLFNIVYMSLSSSIAIIVGNKLGAGELDEAKDTSRKMIAFAIFCSVFIGIIISLLSPLFPMLYKTSDEVRHLATYLIVISAAFMPVFAFANACYFTIRSGGKVLTTIIFDSVFMCAIALPTAFILSRFTSIDIYLL
ncbi:MAG: MATE family efflux transporter, partial [Clostridia bacterium]|nr:MATE family efflux transporter [Clostridia bacterium]